MQHIRRKRCVSNAFAGEEREEQSRQGAVQMIFRVRDQQNPHSPDRWLPPEFQERGGRHEDPFPVRPPLSLWMVPCQSWGTASASLLSCLTHPPN